jgi:hypothetical protein
MSGGVISSFDILHDRHVFFFAILFFVVIIVEYGLDLQRFASTYPLGTSLTDTLSPAA